MVDQPITQELQNQIGGKRAMLKKAYGAGWIRTIADLEAATYGHATNGYMAKTDYPVLTDTTGVRNVLYGARLWEQIATAENAIGVLGAAPW